MQRRRSIAAAPQRSATETWMAISTLLADTLERSPSISRAEVEDAMTVAAGVGRMLIAGGHLREHPLVLVAPPVHLSIYTVDGQAALDLDENAAAVPGGASVEAWTLHLPTPDPHQAAVTQAAAAHPNLSANQAPADVVSSSMAGAATAHAAGDPVDKAALLRRDPSR